jgi:hypothetical protein
LRTKAGTCRGRAPVLSGGNVLEEGGGPGFFISPDEFLKRIEEKQGDKKFQLGTQKLWR